jgi:paired amphipathic helix protein Sin3a
LCSAAAAAVLLCRLSQQGPQIVELLKKNPTVAIPVIILRLEQKEAEWLRVRAAECRMQQPIV